MNEHRICAMRDWESRHPQERATIPYMNSDGCFASSLEGVCHDADH